MWALGSIPSLCLCLSAFAHAVLLYSDDRVGGAQGLVSGPHTLLLAERLLRWEFIVLTLPAFLPCLHIPSVLWAR